MQRHLWTISLIFITSCHANTSAPPIQETPPVARHPSTNTCYTGSCEPGQEGTKTGATSQNVLGQPLSVCSQSPLTGWFRDGYCRTDDNDRGVHVVCASLTSQFLAYTKAQGNDLSTPRGSFPGLKPGDRWCLCASRWKQALHAGHAPRVVVNATEKTALKTIDLKTLKDNSLQRTQ